MDLKAMTRLQSKLVGLTAGLGIAVVIGVLTAVNGGELQLAWQITAWLALAATIAAGVATFALYRKATPRHQGA